jgi:hypothetical protein
MSTHLCDWNTYEAWEHFLPSTSCLPDTNPFQDLDLSRESWFLYAEMSSPLPVYIHSGWWNSYPGLEELASHLRFALLPGFFGTWLCRDEWDSTYTHDDTCPISLRELFARARGANNRYVSDIPRMEEIAVLLEKPTATSVRKAVKLFNERWANTHTWALQLTLFSSILSVGKHIRENETSELARGMTRSTWLDLCRAADDDLESAAKVLEVVQHAERFV